MQSISKSPQLRSEVALLSSEYVVILLTKEVDEYGAPTERVVSVNWNAGVEPNWYEWLNLYTEDEEEYLIDKIVEVGQREYEL